MSLPKFPPLEQHDTIFLKMKDFKDVKSSKSAFFCIRLHRYKTLSDPLPIKVEMVFGRTFNLDLSDCAMISV